MATCRTSWWFFDCYFDEFLWKCIYINSRCDIFYTPCSCTWWKHRYPIFFYSSSWIGYWCNSNDWYSCQVVERIKSCFFEWNYLLFYFGINVMVFNSCPYYVQRAKDEKSRGKLNRRFIQVFHFVINMLSFVQLTHSFILCSTHYYFQTNAHYWFWRVSSYVAFKT